MSTLHDILHKIITRTTFHSESDREELHAAVNELAAAEEDAAPRDDDQEPAADA